MKKTDRLLYFLALLKIVIPYLLQSPVYEPHRDELLALASGKHLSWGYMDVPPLLSVFAWLTNILGGSMFWIKFWPSLFGAATYIVAGKLVQQLGGKSFALLLLFLPFIFGIYLRIFFLLQPNPLEIFFWMMIAYSIICFIQTNQTKWLYFFGVSVGLGLMSKYSVAFYVISICFALLLTPHRTMFLNKHFWIAVLIAAIIVAPNVIWQTKANLPIVHHLNAVHKTQVQHESRVSFFGNQLLMNLPCFFIWVTGLLYVLFSKDKRFRFIGLAYVFVIIILITGHGKDYYALGAYPVLFAFRTVEIEKFTAIKRRALRYMAVIFSVTFGVFSMPLLLPLFPPEELADTYKKMGFGVEGALKWEDQKVHSLPQDFSDMLGWEEMAKKVGDAYKKLTEEEKEKTIIFCDNYGMAGALKYYAEKYNLPEVYSNKASFLLWIPDSLKYDNVIVIVSDTDELNRNYTSNFKSSEISDSVQTKHARERGDIICVLKGANDKFKDFFRKKVEKTKKDAAIN